MRPLQPKPARDDAPGTTRRRKLTARTAITLCALLAAPAGAQAQTLPTGMPVTRQIPQVMLLPFPGRGDAPGPTGWVLIYRNTLSAADTPQRETGTRVIEVTGAAGAPQIARISWEITHSANDRCPDPVARGCPDSLRILSVPEGFVAVPKSAIVEEHAVQKVFIVPQGMS